MISITGTSLEERRVRGDMIEVYKLMSGKEQIDYKQFFNFTNAPYGLITRRNWQRSDRDWIQGNISSVKE